MWQSPRSISVVINTCNRASSLDRTVAALLQQAGSWQEIIVVNGPSTDETELVLEKYAQRIKIFRCPALNLSMSRNIGIAAAAGDVVAFIDDDALPEPNWAARLLAAYDDSDIGAVGGPVFDYTGLDYQATFIVCDRYGANWTRMEHDPSDLYSFPGAFQYSALIGTNCSFRRDVLLSIGGFDEEYEYYLDETDVCVRVIDAGYKIRQIPNAYVHHKFLPSHMRTAAHTTVNHYPILKNTLYFALKYAAPHVGEDLVDQYIESIYQKHLSDARISAKTKRLDPAVLQALPRVYERAKTDARARAFREDPRHISATTLSAYRSQFLPSAEGGDPSSPDEKLTVALLCRHYDFVDSGIARFIGVQARALAAMGHTVHVLTSSQKESSVDWEHGVWVHRILTGWHDRATDPAVPQVHIDQWCHSMSVLQEIAKIHERHQIDVVEAPLWDNEAIALVASRRFPVVVSLQTSQAIALESHPEWQDNQKFMREVVSPTIDGENYVLQHCTVVRTISRAIADDIFSRNSVTLPTEKLALCHLSLEDRAQNAALATVDEDLVLFIGRLELRKGIDTLLQAIPLVLAQVPHARFVIIGDDTLPAGRNDRTFREIFESEHPEYRDIVRFTGRISDAEVDDHFRRARLFVAPSRYESFGLIYVEAMMFGVPSIGCEVGGIAEVMGNGNSGALVPVDDPIGLAQAVIRELTDTSGVALKRLQARTSYESRFTPDLMAHRITKIYQQAILAHKNQTTTASNIEKRTL
ncbi:group 1 glycosyl transferase [Ralstonia sp. NT80]|nr:hypothetical protein C404_16060 [Ralstonia sp. AU12-08]GAQ30117.1 group 1 glycosyl transferase [Ralstonia sp. NT80]